MQSINVSAEQNSRDFDEFCLNIKRRIQCRLGTKFYVSVQELAKNNGIKLRELTIRDNRYNNLPSVCLNCYYRKFQKDRNFDAIEIDIIGSYKENGVL